MVLFYQKCNGFGIFVLKNYWSHFKTKYYSHYFLSFLLFLECQRIPTYFYSGVIWTKILRDTQPNLNIIIKIKNINNVFIGQSSFKVCVTII